MLKNWHLFKTGNRQTGLFDSMKSIKNNKTPSNDRLTNEFCEAFWYELKAFLMESANQAFHMRPIIYFTKTSCHQDHWEKRPG